jgi:acyl carrier protein
LTFTCQSVSSEQSLHSNFVAGGAYYVDDAEIGKAGSCEIEFWSLFAANGDRIAVFSPACVMNPGRPVELGTNLVGLRSNGQEDVLATLTAKTGSDTDWPERIRIGDCRRSTRRAPLIANQLGVDVKRVTDEAHFTDDLGADWLDRLELMIVIEDRFADVVITEEDVDQLEVVGDLIRHIETRIMRCEDAPSSRRRSSEVAGERTLGVTAPDFAELHHCSGRAPALEGRSELVSGCRRRPDDRP